MFRAQGVVRHDESSQREVHLYIALFGPSGRAKKRRRLSGTCRAVAYHHERALTLYTKTTGGASLRKSGSREPLWSPSTQRSMQVALRLSSITAKSRGSNASTFNVAE